MTKYSGPSLVYVTLSDNYLFMFCISGTAFRFTEIPQDKYPPGSTPEEITKHYLDQSYSLELMIAQHDE